MVLLSFFIIAHTITEFSGISIEATFSGNKLSIHSPIFQEKLLVSTNDTAATIQSDEIHERSGGCHDSGKRCPGQTMRSEKAARQVKSELSSKCRLVGVSRRRECMHMTAERWWRGGGGEHSNGRGLVVREAERHLTREGLLWPEYWAGEGEQRTWQRGEGKARRQWMMKGFVKTTWLYTKSNEGTLKSFKKKHYMITFDFQKYDFGLQCKDWITGGNGGNRTNTRWPWK